MDPTSTIPLSSFSNIKEDEDAVNRQRIRAAILDGDVDKALKHTNAYYPNVLKDNEHIYFRLRSRKFIEMIRRTAEVRERTNGISKGKNGNVDSALYDEDVVQTMELDEPESGFETMDTSDSDGKSTLMEYDILLQEAIHYGQGLQAEFDNDPRIEVKRALTDCFSLLAYEDPIRSSQVAHLLTREGRQEVAEELNSAILGKIEYSTMIFGNNF